MPRLQLRPADLLAAIARMRLTPAVYDGFVEHAYRLVFPYEEHFAPHEPHLFTLLPSGVVENEKDLSPKAEKGLIAYPYPQTIESEKVPEQVRGTPFVWERADGTLGLMQTWPTSYNAKFKSDFEIATSNPDPSKFDERGAADFKQTCSALFGERATERTPILYCHRASSNGRRVYVGDAATLLHYLRVRPEVAKELSIESLTSDGFVANVVDGKGKTSTKAFTMAAEGEYCLYTKLGWETMACVTPLEQFVRDRDLGSRVVE